MHLVEVRQKLKDTTVKKDIYNINSILNKLMEFVENQEELSFIDYSYITSLLSRTEKLLYKTYTIFKLNNEEVSEHDKKVRP